ncbi:MAG: ATP-dependent DNA helicase RecG, partial [Treponemataceae bacterium]|nr:ATP-dependent DNA helicase RecG [Treponemataceae bacterium]
VRKAVAAAVSRYVRGIEDELPEKIIRARGLLSKQAAVKLIHQPDSPQEIQEARRTLIYEELFQFQCVMAERAWRHKGAIPAADLSVADAAAEDAAAQPDVLEDAQEAAFAEALSPLQRQLYGRLGFPLTPDQRKVVSEMNAEIDRGYTERNSLLNGNAGKTPFTMARLLQGDVGSGKTLVAFFACLRAISWKGQCAFMAPTEILARQHAESAARLLEPLGVTVAFLTGNVKAAGRMQLLKALKSGEIDIIIGTHALFSAQVVYKDLQLVVIDEQHRFGVVQRQTIISKGRQLESDGGVTLEPHLLMMSATPIPQTLALTVFGDLDVSSIKTMPPGRKPVQTYLVCEGNERNAYSAVRKQLLEGRQAYFVYPAISSEFSDAGGAAGGATDDGAEFRNGGSAARLKSAEEMFQTLSTEVYPEFKCALLHSKIDEEEQIRILSDFRSGKIHVLAATTVIEVGVDVPNATCIVIEQADRFGLAQLHQLRGRVGRGGGQAFCFLIYSRNITQAGIERMKVLRQSTDGFLIADQDLKLRGPGEIAGTLQAGNLTLGIADIVRDHDILVQARADAFQFMQNTLQGGAAASDGAS